MTAETVANGDLFIHGGVAKVDVNYRYKAQQDTWKLKFDSYEWEQLQDSPEPKC